MDEADAIKIPITTHTTANQFDINSRQKHKQAQLHSPHSNTYEHPEFSRGVSSNKSLPTTPFYIMLDIYALAELNNVCSVYRKYNQSLSILTLVLAFHVPVYGGFILLSQDKKIFLMSISILVYVLHFLYFI